jgi:hypothetical protein
MIQELHVNNVQVTRTSFCLLILSRLLTFANFISWAARFSEQIAANFFISFYRPIFPLTFVAVTAIGTFSFYCLAPSICGLVTI